MAKHSQTIRRQQFTNCLSGFDHFVGLVLKGLKNILKFSVIYFRYFQVSSALFYEPPEKYATSITWNYASVLKLWNL